MIPVTSPVSPAGKAMRTARQPALSERAAAIIQMNHAPREQSSHCHHNRSDGLKSTAGIVALACGKFDASLPQAEMIARAAKFW